MQAIAVQADVAVEADVQRMFDTTAAELGQLTVLVNNAGILHPQARLDSYPYGRLREVFDVNVIGAFLCAREAVLRMSTRHGGSGGSIVNVSSAASYLGSPDEFIDYAASKGAIDTLTIGLAKEVGAEGIRVNAVRPGLIDTEIHARSGEPGRAARLSANVPMRRVGTADEVAATIMWLASDEAGVRERRDRQLLRRPLTTPTPVLSASDEPTRRMKQTEAWIGRTRWPGRVVQR